MWQHKCVMPHALSNHASQARCVPLALRIRASSACAAGGCAQRPHCVSRRVIARVGHVAPSTSPCHLCNATALPAAIRQWDAAGCALGGPRVRSTRRDAIAASRVHPSAARATRPRVGRGGRGRRPAPRAPRPRSKSAPHAPRPRAPLASPGSRRPGRPAPPFLSGPHPTPRSHLLLTA